MISPCLLAPDIDLTTEESQWRDVSLWYWMVMKDEFEHNDRAKYYALKWLLENRKWPEWKEWAGYEHRWHWVEDQGRETNWKFHCQVFTEDFIREMWEGLSEEYGVGHSTFGDSILFFTSLWPRFYLDVVLPTQEGEPANAEEFWENLGLCVPGEDWREAIKIFFSKDHLDEPFWGYHWSDKQFEIKKRPVMDRIAEEKRNDPHYRWTYGNAVIRAVKAWRETE